MSTRSDPGPLFFVDPNSTFATTTSTTGATAVQLVATPTGVLRNYITQLTLANSSASNITVTMNNGVGVTTYVIPAPTTGGAVLYFEPPLRSGVATAWYFIASAGVSTLYVSANGYTGV